MPQDAGKELKTQLRADLRAAMKERRTFEVKLLRALLAAIENAEAPPLPTGQTASSQHPFTSFSAEVDRLLLSSSDLHRVLSAEIQERETAAAELERRNLTERAEALRAEAVLAKRYLG